MTRKQSQVDTPAQSGSADDSKKQDKASEISLFALFKSMSAGEWAALIAILITVGGTAVGAGSWLEQQQRIAAVEQATTPLKAEIEGLKASNASLNATQFRLEAANRAMDSQLKLFAVNVQYAESFATFAENYINYLAGGGEPAKLIFIDYVCSLYRESQEKGRNIEFTASSFREIVGGSLNASLEELEASGFNAQLAAELRELQARGLIRFLPEVSRQLGREIAPLPFPTTSPLTFPTARRLSNPDKEAIISGVSKSVDAREGRMIKTVTFPGRSPFVLPQEIALAVHSDRNCRVR